MRKISILLQLIIFVGLISLIPNSFGGSTQEELCFNENFEKVPCDDPTCFGAEIGKCREPTNNQPKKHVCENDADLDGICFSSDNCPDEPEDYNGIQDWDGCPDDLDSDNDQVYLPYDRCPLEQEVWNEFRDDDGCPDFIPGQKKIIETQPNYFPTEKKVKAEPTWENDRDRDGILDSVDNCPKVINPNQLDADKDGIGNLCDPNPFPGPDADKDGIGDSYDNCLLNSNFDQRDSDNDGKGDICDPIDDRKTTDTDKDGIMDFYDICKLTPENFNSFEDEDGCPDTDTAEPDPICGQGSQLKDGKCVPDTKTGDTRQDYFLWVILAVIIAGVGSILVKKYYIGKGHDSPSQDSDERPNVVTIEMETKIE